jgi:ATP-dependent RNA helicase DHX8/PRP22
MLLTSVDLGCADEIMTICAMLQVQNVWYRPRDKMQVADQRKARFNHGDGDHLTLLAVYDGWMRENCSPVWCFENYVQARSLKRAQDTKKQLVQIMDKLALPVESCKRGFDHRHLRRDDFNSIRKAIAAGFFNHACRKD